ncbi:MAG: SnoaL-like domain-containing protein [Clostridiales bacterium]|nr:SnoaL-like domain-containing protein [Clostridiales bacterium]
MSEHLEERLKKLEEAVLSLQEKLSEKEKQIQDLLDIEAIERLQNIYGYYLEHWMSEEIIDLFADHPEVSATFVEGTYLGIEGVRRYFGRMRFAAPTFLHQVMQVSPVITLSDDRRRAKGRFYGYGTICSAMKNDKIDPMYMSVVYEMEFIRQDGVWKILKLAFLMHYAYKHDSEQKAVPDENKTEPRERPSFSSNLSPDIWAEYDTQYPSGYIYPMHFKHPVTGKKTAEDEYNAGLDLIKSRFLPK